MVLVTGSLLKTFLSVGHYLIRRYSHCGVQCDPMKQVLVLSSGKPEQVGGQDAASSWQN